jgi:hypothetical protein
MYLPESCRLGLYTMVEMPKQKPCGDAIAFKVM